MDEIQRKLLLIEAQLSGRNLPARLVATAPLFFLAMGLMAGIVTQEILSAQPDGSSFSPGLWLWAGLLAACVAGIGVYLFVARRDPQPPIVACGALLCFVSLEALRLMVFQQPAGQDIQNLVGAERTLATVRGQICTRPFRQRQDWCFARFAFSDPTSTFYLKTTQVKTEPNWTDTTGTLRVRVAEPTPNLHIGDIVQLYCWLYRFEPPTNPGQFDLAAHLKRRNVHLGASVPSRDAIEVLEEPEPNTLGHLRGWLSEAASYALLGDGAEDPNGLLEALLLGNRQNIDRQTYEAFRKTGLLHMISLSGLHLGIFVGLIWWLVRTAGLSKRGRALVCIVATAAFLMVVPPRAPTVRATIIVWTFCAAIFLRRHPHPFNTLCLAAIILLLIRPTQLFEVGWQLSFASVAGILAFTNPIERFIDNWTSRWLRQKKSPLRFSRKIIEYIGTIAMRLFSMGLAAWIGGTGILLYHFYTITPLTSLWTVVVFPLVALILTLGFSKIALFFLLPTLSHLLGFLANAGVWLLIRIVKLLAIPEINCILIGHVALWVIVLYYGLVLFTRFGRTRRNLWKHGLCLLMALALVGHIGVLKWQRTCRDNLRMTCLDVGHGQAILVQLPGTKNLLFDAGSMYRSDVGSQVVLPFLDYMGMSHLHAIVISHSDIDHINGIPEIVDRRRIDHIYADEAFFAHTKANSPPDVLAKHLHEKGHTLEQPPQKLQGGAATISTLWPVGDPNSRDHLSDNDRSLVSQIACAGVSILLCSDIEAFAQQRIMALYPNLTGQVVVVPHHGSRATRSEAFLPSLQPEVAIVSSGARQLNQQQLPTADFHPEYFFTAKNGAVTICVGNEGMVETWPTIHGSEGD